MNGVAQASEIEAGILANLEVEGGAPDGCCIHWGVSQSLIVLFWGTGADNY
jgi:hypothetical protein